MHHCSVLLYFVLLLEDQNSLDGNEQVSPKLIYPIPVHGIKQHRIEIDGEILYYLLKDAGVMGLPDKRVNGKPMNAPNFITEEYHQPYFDEYFAHNQFTNDHKEFNYGNAVTTNNVKLSIKMKVDPIADVDIY
jgi:hypothetical protein